MPRIQQAARSIDQALPTLHLSRCRIAPSPCRAALASSRPLLGSSAAAFSTTSRANALLDGKNDKKKHNAMVRRWQKRLLGEAEPIGAHVDPYDPTSPVRISPEEMGEEVEVLKVKVRKSDQKPNKLKLAQEKRVRHVEYQAAKSGEGLKRVGGDKWRKELEEIRLAERLEKMVAQPGRLQRYTTIFAPTRQERDQRTLHDLFHQAVVEIYTLKQAGLSADVTTSPSRGFYGQSKFDFSQVKFAVSPTTKELELLFPSPEAQAQLLAKIQGTYEQLEVKQDMEDLLEDVAEAEAFEQSQQLVDQAAVEAAQAPAVPITPPVKVTEGKAFDFMSNRPVPRAKPAEKPATTKVLEDAQTELNRVEQTEEHMSKAQQIDVEAAAEAVRKGVAELRHTVLEHSAQKSEKSVTAMLHEVRRHIESLSADSITMIEPTVEKMRFRFISVSDPNILFALSKRILTLTGHRIPDAALSTTHTLADLLAALIATSQPKAVKVVEKLMESEHTVRLTKLPNVNFQPRNVGQIAKERALGRWKVIQYALRERGLPVEKRDAPKRRLL